MVAENPEFAWAYGWNRFNMAVIGAWPDVSQGFIARNIAWLYAGTIFLIIWLPMTASIAYVHDDLEELISNLVINVPVALCIYKIVLFRVRREDDQKCSLLCYYEQKALETILEAMAVDWSAMRSEDERKVMTEKAKYARFISVMSVGLASSVMFTFSCTGVWTARHERPFITNETKIGVGFLYTSWFPYDTTKFRPFVWTWLGQWFATIVAMIGYSGPDSSISMLILHLCGQLATVRLALTKIVDEECIKNPSIYWKRLAVIIERHEELNRCGELLEESFNFMLLIQMVLCTLTFCFQGFVTITTLLNGSSSDGEFPIFRMAFCVIHGCYTILHLFVYCWTGDMLVVESTSLGYAPYDSDWFFLPPEQAKALMMITNRARIPLEITAGKFIGFSLELFTSIMKTSMGYLSVLLAVKET